MLFERRVALSPPISVRTYLVRHSLSNFWPLGEEPCVCVCVCVEGGGRFDYISFKQRVQGGLDNIRTFLSIPVHFPPHTHAPPTHIFPT